MPFPAWSAHRLRSWPAIGHKGSGMSHPSTRPSRQYTPDANPRQALEGASELAAGLLNSSLEMHVLMAYIVFSTTHIGRALPVLSRNENLSHQDWELTLIVMPNTDFWQLSQTKDVREAKHIHLFALKLVPVAALLQGQSASVPVLSKYYQEDIGVCPCAWIYKPKQYSCWVSIMLEEPLLNKAWGAWGPPWGAYCSLQR